MNKFAFIGHPISLKHFYGLSGRFSFFAQKLPPYMLKRIMLRLPVYRYNDMKIESVIGVNCKGFGIVVPLLPEQVALLGEEETLKRVITAAKLAEKLGAKVVGLGGFTSVVGNEGEIVARKVNIAVTSGNTFPVYLSLAGIKKAAEKMQLDMKSATVAIIGATGDIGSISAKILSRQVKKIYIVARNQQKTKEFAKVVSNYGSAEVNVPADMEEAIQDSDIILTATTAIASIIDPLRLKVGAIVCDVAVPANVTKEVVRLRDDVLVFEGGLTKLPLWESLRDPKLDRAMVGQNCIFGCLAETMLLTLEGKFENFSIGRGNITEEKVNEIGRIASKHGFEISDFFCGYKIFNEEDIEGIRLNALRKKNASC